jgi:hypothetical protein
MQVLEGTFFTCLQDRFLSVGTISLAAWSPNQDLLALVFIPASVVILRLSWQLVGAWRPPDDHQESHITSITALCWSPRGSNLLLGQADGTLRLLSVETMETMTIHRAADDPEQTDYGGWTHLLWHPLPKYTDAGLVFGLRERSSDVFLFMGGIYACGCLSISRSGPVLDLAMTDDADYLAVLGIDSTVLVSALEVLGPVLSSWDILARWDIQTRERMLQLQCGLQTLQEHWNVGAQAMGHALDTFTETLSLYRPDVDRESAFRELLLVVYGMAPTPAMRDWLANVMSETNQRTHSRSVVASLKASLDFASDHLLPQLNALLAHVARLLDVSEATLERTKACWLAGHNVALSLKQLRPLYIAFWNWLAGRTDEHLQLLVDREKIVTLFRKKEFGLPDMDGQLKAFAQALAALDATLQARRRCDRMKRWQLECLTQISIPLSSILRDDTLRLKPALRWLASIKRFQLCTDQGELWLVAVDGSFNPWISVSSLLTMDLGSVIYSIEWYRDQQICILTSKGLLCISPTASSDAGAATEPALQCRFRPLALNAKPPSRAPAKTLQTPALVCGVARGLASVFPTTNHILIFDLEDHEESIADQEDTDI